MRPRWINPPKIEKGDPQIPLIEQIDEMYWEPHDMRLRHCYQLSNWYLEFRGELSTLGLSPIIWVPIVIFMMKVYTPVVTVRTGLLLKVNHGGRIFLSCMQFSPA